MAAWARRRQGEDALPVALHRRRLYIVPTRAGLGLGALVVVMLVAGLNYGNGAALLVTFALAGFGLVAMHRCHRNLLGLAIESIDALPAFAGEAAPLLVRFGNPTALPRAGLEIGVLEARSAPVDVASGATVQAHVSVTGERRGVLRLDRIRVCSEHPFGLFRTWTWIHAPIDRLVYPPPRGFRPMPESAGDATGSRPHDATGMDEWHGLRAFRDGDSPRHVDWRAYARGGPLLVKEFAALASEERIFDFDALPPIGTEARLEQLARWIVDAEARGERYGLRLPGVAIAPDRGPQHRHACLAALARHDLAPARSPTTTRAPAPVPGRPSTRAASSTSTSSPGGQRNARG